MSFTPVQQATPSGNINAPVTATFGSVATVGNLVVVSIAYTNGGTPTVTDNLGNVYKRIITVHDGVSNNFYIELWYAIVAVSGTITVTFGGSPGNWCGIMADEYSATGVISVYASHGSSSGGGGTSLTASTGTIPVPTGSNLVYGATYVDGSASAYTVTAGAGFTLRGNLPSLGGSSFTAATEHQVGVSSSVAATFSISQSLVWQAVGASFTVSPPPLVPHVVPFEFFPLHYEE